MMTIETLEKNLEILMQAKSEGFKSLKATAAEMAEKAGQVATERYYVNVSNIGIDNVVAEYQNISKALAEINEHIYSLREEWKAEMPMRINSICILTSDFVVNKFLYAMKEIEEDEGIEDVYVKDDEIVIETWTAGEPAELHIDIENGDSYMEYDEED